MATNWVNLEAEKWVKVADGPCTIQKVNGVNIKVYTGTNDPDDTSPYGFWNYGEFQYGGDDSVYMKAPENLRVTVFT